jgi:hypothetical protein
VLASGADRTCEDYYEQAPELLIKADMPDHVDQINNDPSKVLGAVRGSIPHCSSSGTVVEGKDYPTDRVDQK